MCLCKYVTFTFSNRMAFRRLDYKLNKLDKERERRVYPEGTIYVIESNNVHTPEERERLPYKVLRALSESSIIEVTIIHFEGVGRV